MREIKFRAWDKNTKKMDDVAILFPPVKSEHENIVFMQYTGLKDKNGVEIYEGDVVTMHQFLFDGSEIEKQIGGVIGWGEYGVTIKQVRNEYIEEYCGWDAGEGELYLNEIYGLHEDSWIVVGNIHENPELLNAN